MEEQRAQAFQHYEEQIHELRNTFIKHDLSRLAARKPGLIERRINSGTIRVFNKLERASSFGHISDAGDPITSEAASDHD
jgi:hypothetical protein